MFYTLISKLVSRESLSLFKVFLFGSILYILLHYYLYSFNTITFLDQYKSYLYYVVLLDLGVSYYMIKSSKHSSHKSSNEDSEKKYSKEKTDEINKTLDELRKLQAEQLENKSVSSPFITNKELNEQNNQPDNKSLSVSSSNKQKLKIKKQNKESKILDRESRAETDDNIPVFMG